MKKVLALVWLLSGISFGYEVKDNPDRFPSLGVNYTGYSLKGDTKYTNIVWTPQPEMKDTFNSFMGDARFPINNILTIEAGVGYAARTIEGIDGSVVGNSLFYDTTKSEMTGPIYKVGARLYFH